MFVFCTIKYWKWEICLTHDCDWILYIRSSGKMIYIWNDYKMMQHENLGSWNAVNISIIIYWIQRFMDWDMWAIGNAHGRNGEQDWVWMTHFFSSPQTTPFSKEKWINFRSFFGIMFVLVLIFSVYFIINVWNRWNESPLVVTLSAISTSIRDIPFPGKGNHDGFWIFFPNNTNVCSFLSQSCNHLLN